MGASCKEQGAALLGCGRVARGLRVQGVRGGAGGQGWGGSGGRRGCGGCGCRDGGCPLRAQGVRGWGMREVGVRGWRGRVWGCGDGRV